MSKKLLLGDEAIAQAALDAGLSGVYAYPGTPSTEITEYIQGAAITRERNIHSRWSANEKTAMEAALGMSFVGKRAMVCMKHVGMNVAADCFVNSAITGVKGGLIVVAADDPSMHSSQNEQDSRFYGDFSFVPMYEPSNQQEAYDMVYHGFEFSEQVGEPVLLRVVTRLAHSRSGVETKEVKGPNAMSFSDDPRQFILLPGNARKRYKELLDRQADFVKASEESPYNKYTDGENKKLGIVACGIGYNYLMENYPEGCEYPVLKIGTVEAEVNADAETILRLMGVFADNNDMQAVSQALDLIFKPEDVEAICNLKMGKKKLSAKALMTIIQEAMNLVMGEDEGEVPTRITT